MDAFRRTLGLLVLLTIIVSIHIPVATGIIRHEKTFKEYKVRTYEAFLRILEILLSDPEVQMNPELVNELKALYEALKRGDTLKANDVLSRIMEIVEDPELMRGLSVSARSLLPFISAWEVRGGREPEINVDPERLRRALRSIAENPEELSRSVETIEEAARIVGELDPALSIRLEEVAQLLKSGSYEEAAKIYFEVLAELAESIPRLLESETYDPEKLIALFSKLPVSISSLGSATSSINFLVYLVTFLERGEEREANARRGVEVGRILVPIIDAQKTVSKLLSSNFGNMLLFMTSLLAPVLLIFIYRYSKSSINILDKVVSKVSSRIETTSLNFKLALTRTVRDRIVAVYNATINVMKGRGVYKRSYETHREFALKTKNKNMWETPYVTRICNSYEKACFSGREVSEEDFQECLENFRRIVLR